MVLLESNIEEVISDDISLEYSLQINGNTAYWLDSVEEIRCGWSLVVNLPLLEEYLHTEPGNEQMLDQVMEKCKAIEEVFDEQKDTLSFSFLYKDKYVYVNHNSGSLDFGDKSSGDTFYYYEFAGERYLRNGNTRYTLPID